ncbi:RNA-directed DNA polymerase, eukaryota, reverse transcriptase zinc-binding domain protein [Tanacetum coccineum]
MQVSSMCGNLWCKYRPYGDDTCIKGFPKGFPTGTILALKVFPQHCDKGCRIMLGWNSDHVSVNLVNCAKQSMFCELQMVSGNKKVYCTFVYAANGARERKDLWKDLQIQKSIVGNQAWFMMGDMNVILSPNEHSAGCSYMTCEMNDFKDCINNIKMEDVVSNGLFYTWTKNLYKTKMGDATGVLKKLDRIMRNEEFIDKSLKQKKKAFKFANFVADKKEFLPSVKNLWEKEFEGCQMFKTVKKLKSLKRDLKKLSWKDGNIFEKVKALKLKLKEIQAKIDTDPYDKDLRMEESQCILEYVDALKDEEKLLFQKAKIKWLKVRDRNNSYFHKVLKSRSHKNRINTIRDSLGNLFHGDDVVAQFVKHFQQFLSNVEPVKDFEPFSYLIQKKLSAANANSMVREVSDDEIKETMFQIDGNKAPGPYGLSSLFFKKAWGIVGGNVCSAIKEFFSTGIMLREINSTLISLIPKIATPDKVTDFRPIACCNVIYKCISKIITNRIKGSLGSIVGQYQSAFVPNRHIQDNILLSQELLKGYERKDRPNRVAMKIDIQKAYDTVNWEFLEAILKGFGFHEKMVQWIICCISTASFSISVYGESFGYFKGQRVKTR